MQLEQKVNILLVDDRPENLLALEAVLGDLGQNLVKAGSGSEALKQLLRDDFAVILLDVQMPEMDGYQTAKLIRSREKSRHTPLIFLTAINTSASHVSEGYSVGAVDYVCKPFSPEILKSKVARFVELSKKSNELKAEVAERKWAEEEAKRLSQELERRVVERTAELHTANRELEGEITARQRAAETLRFLAEASIALSASLDYQTTLERVARLSVPALADWCAVDTREPDGTFSRLAFAHKDPAQEERAWEMWRRYPPRPDDQVGLPSVQRSGQSELYPEITDSFLGSVAHNEEHLRLLREMGLSSAMVVPLPTRGLMLGALSLTMGDSGRQYGTEDLVVAEDLARRAAGAIDNARLFQELQEAARAKDDFLAMLGHELRNPLAPVRNAMAAMRARGTDDSLLLRQWDVIERQMQQFSRLVDDLLDVSRITHGRIELRVEPLNLAVRVLSAVELARPEVDARGLDLTVSCPPEPLWLAADPVRLQQVIVNLLNNAIKFTEPGGRLWVSVELEEAPGGDAGGTAVLRVRDTGLGIAPELLPRVFDLFTQADRSLDRSRGGLGLGLTLVKRLVEMHGGSVGASSDGPGRGSEFVVRLPLRQGSGVRGQGSETTLAPTPALPELAPDPRPLTPAIRVLVVDDNVSGAETLADLLVLWGCDVQVAHHGLAALELAAQYLPEVVLLDIGLPGMDGYEVAQRLRELVGLEGALLVAVTGYGQEEDRRRSQEAALDHHLTKPVDPDVLRRLITGSREERPLTS
jgi:signal transduction histidine kinase/DNA-binding response OmpR family regulator